MTCNNIILSQPDAGATLSHEIPDDVSARLNFGPDDISGLRIGDNGELVISFAKGGQLNITNFESIVDNGNLLYLEDGTLVDPSILTGSLKSPQDFNGIETAAGTSSAVAAGDVIASAIELAKPQANTTQQISVQDGQKYVCNFDPTNANVEVRGGKMYLTFADGSQIVINNFAKADLPEALIPEQEILTQVDPIQEVLAFEAPQAEKVEEPKIAIRQSVAEEVATIEPAAGEIASTGLNLGDINPGAGDAGSGSNTGYGFGSAPDAASFNGADAIGAIGPTALGYVAPDVTPERAPIISSAAIDSAPVALSSQVGLDETNFTNGTLVGTGTVGVDFGADGAGSILPNGSFNATCEVAGGVLTSNGVAVDVVATQNGYVGTANGVAVFTFELDPETGDYVYTQTQPFDHADTSNTNEEICLDFGVVVTDGDGDRAVTTVRVNVLDDAPIIGDDVNTIDETNLENGVITVTDSVAVDFGRDGRGSVTTAGDFSSTGSKANDALTSNGVAVVVTQTINGYVGKAGDITVFTLDIDSATGAYTFKQFENLDHADANNDNDIITLNFPIEITDYDGDSDSGVIQINVKDDAPEAVNDAVTVDDGDTVTGNVQNNDDAGQDAQAIVTQVVIGGQTYDVPATGTIDVPGQYGTLTIAASGAYSYVAANGNTGGVDEFTYTLRDGDGDTSTAVLKITVEDDEVPININGVGQTDDTDLADDGKDVATGTINVDYQGDGPGTTTGNGSFDSSGNRTDNALSSHGVPVTVMFDADTNTYTGVTSNIHGTVQVVFTMVINADETYEFTQLAPLDHSDTNSNNEALFLDFGVDATDSDGDTGTGTVRVTVLDDGPSITTRAHPVDEDDGQQNGLIVVQDKITHDFGQDGAGTIEPNGKVEVKYTPNGVPQTLTSNGVAVVITQTADGYVGKVDGFTLFSFAIDPASGEYEYKQFGPVDHPEEHDVMWLKLGVDVIDADGDSAPGYVVFDIEDDEPHAVDDKIELDAGNKATGNVLDNDDAGADGHASVTTVTFEGQDYTVPTGGSVTVEGDHGTLVMNSDGTYTYDANSGDTQTVYSFDVNHPEGGDSDRGAGVIENVSGSFNADTNELNFSFVIEGTQANGFTLVMNGGENPRGNGGEVAMLYFDASRAGEPVITAYAYGGDSFSYRDGTREQPGNQAPDRILSSTDANDAFGNISVTTDGNGNQIFSFTMDATDIINHNPAYGVAGTDWSGIGFGEEMGLWFHPYADITTSYDADGNLLTFTNEGQSFWDESNVPTTVTTTGGSNAGEDHFTYTMVDADGDTSTADLNVCVDEDDVPTIVTAVEAVYEDDIAKSANGEICIQNTIQHDFGHDGAGSIQSNGNVKLLHEVGGAPQTLTSGGVAVIVTQTASGYIGRVAGETLFTFAINSATGEYTYKQYGPVDHVEGHPVADDVMWLKLGVDIVDADGDTASGYVVLDIYDDKPVAFDDKLEIEANHKSSGDVLANDEQGLDGHASVTTVTFEGQDYTVPTGGSVTVEGDHGTLVMNSDGTYTYDANSGDTQTVYSFDVNHPEGGDSDRGAGVIENVSGSFNADTNELNFSFVIEGTQANGFTLVMNGGENPRGNGGEVAMLYFDASRAGEPVITAYAYGGDSFSYRDGTREQPGNQAPDRILSSTDANDAFGNISVTTDGNGNQIFSFTMDATDIINHNPAYGVAGTDWSGIGFGEEMGLWFHPYADITTSYDADGNLLTFTNEGQSFWDESNVPTTVTTTGGSNAGEDHFTYTMVDADGDTSTADLNVCVDDTRSDIINDGANLIYVDGAGVFSGSADTDLFILNAIQNATPTLTNFEVGEDHLDLSKLLDGVDDVTAAIQDFVSVTNSADGQDTLVSVDLDGQGAGTAQFAVRLAGTNDNTLEDLIENNTIIV